MKNFEQFGVQELNAVEMKEINGGGGVFKALKKIGEIIGGILTGKEVVEEIGVENIKDLGKNISDSINSSGKYNPVGTWM